MLVIEFDDTGFRRVAEVENCVDLKWPSVFYFYFFGFLLLFVFISILN